MSDNTPISIKKSFSPRLYAFWPGMQDSGDGRTQVLDRSGNNRNLSVGAGDTYGAVTSVAGYATVTGAAQPTDKSLATAEVFPWDMLQGQSLLIHYVIKAAAPGANGQIFNARGAGGAITTGFSHLVNLNGQPQVQVRDGTTTYTSTLATGTNLCDDAAHTVVIMIDGTGKRAYGWMDGAAWSSIPSGEAITATAGSTQGTRAARWGAAGDFVLSSLGTWVAARTLGLRYMAIYTMPYWPANYLTLLAEITRNPHRPLSARLLP